MSEQLQSVGISSSGSRDGAASTAPRGELLLFFSDNSSEGEKGFEDYNLQALLGGLVLKGPSRKNVMLVASLADFRIDLQILFKYGWKYY